MDKKPGNALPKNVDEYIKDASVEAQPKLKELRQIIQEIAPMAEERMSYQMAGYFYRGALVYFGGFKNHVSLFGAGSAIYKLYEDELKDYKTSKGTIQFPLEKPLPTGLIKKIVRERIRENEEHKPNK